MVSVGSDVRVRCVFDSNRFNQYLNGFEPYAPVCATVVWIWRWRNGRDSHMLAKLEMAGTLGIPAVFGR